MRPTGEIVWFDPRHPELQAFCNQYNSLVGHKKSALELQIHRVHSPTMMHAAYCVGLLAMALAIYAPLRSVMSSLGSRSVLALVILVSAGVTAVPIYLVSFATIFTYNYKLKGIITSLEAIGPSYWLREDETAWRVLCDSIRVRNADIKRILREQPKTTAPIMHDYLVALDGERHAASEQLLTLAATTATRLINVHLGVEQHEG